MLLWGPWAPGLLTHEVGMKGACAHNKALNKWHLLTITLLQYY